MWEWWLYTFSTDNKCVVKYNVKHPALTKALLCTWSSFQQVYPGHELQTKSTLKSGGLRLSLLFHQMCFQGGLTCCMKRWCGKAVSNAGILSETGLEPLINLDLSSFYFSHKQFINQRTAVITVYNEQTYICTLPHLQTFINLNTHGIYINKCVLSNQHVWLFSLKQVF